MDQLQQLIQAVVSGDQQAMQQFQQLIQDPQQGPQVIQAIQQMAQQGDPGAQQLMQMLGGGQEGGGEQQAPPQEGAPMAARLGGKLRTVKVLNNVCPDGYELKSFRAGGTLCKKCMKKAEDGTKIEKKPANAAEEFKQAKGKGKPEAKEKIGKKQLGGLVTPQAVEKFKAFKQGGAFNRKITLRTKNK